MDCGGMRSRWHGWILVMDKNQGVAQRRRLEIASTSSHSRRFVYVCGNTISFRDIHGSSQRRRLVVMS